MTGSGDMIGPATGRALDRFDVPPARAGFAERIAAAAAQPAGLPVYRPGRRRRDRWSRKVFIGVLAVGLTSATAVAATMFGGVRMDLPRIAQFFAPDPVPPPAAAPKLRQASVKPRPAKPPLQVSQPAVTAPVAPVAARVAARREIIVDRIERRLEMRGMAVPREAISARVERVQQAIRTDPAVRRQLWERLARRRAARAADGPAVSAPPTAGEIAGPAATTEAEPVGLTRIERRRAWARWRAERLRREALRESPDPGREGSEAVVR